MKLNHTLKLTLGIFDHFRLRVSLSSEKMKYLNRLFPDADTREPLLSFSSVAFLLMFFILIPVIFIFVTIVNYFAILSMKRALEIKCTYLPTIL